VPIATPRAVPPPVSTPSKPRGLEGEFF